MTGSSFRRYSINCFYCFSLTSDLISLNIARRNIAICSGVYRSPRNQVLNKWPSLGEMSINFRDQMYTIARNTKLNVYQRAAGYDQVFVRVTPIIEFMNYERDILLVVCTTVKWSGTLILYFLFMIFWYFLFLFIYLFIFFLQTSV